MSDVRKEIEKQIKAEGGAVPPSAETLVEAWVGQVERMRDAAARIKEEGLVVAGPKDSPVPHPAIQIEKAAAAEAVKLRKEVMTAVRRGR